jgi:hypothetical protein
MINESVVTGRLVAFVRISSLHSELDSQKEIIAQFTSRVGNFVRRWYEDPDRPRWKAEHSDTLRQILRDAEDRQFDWVILDKQSRLGTFNHFEFFAYLQQFISAGVRVWSVADGELTSPDIVTSIRSVTSSQSEVEDQKNKAGNVLRGMYLNAKRFRYNGAVLPYAYDRICRSADGTERFRVVEESRKANPGYVPRSKRREESKYVFTYLVIYPNGHTERLAESPGKGKHEYYDFAVTILSERVEVVRLVYQLYVGGHSLNEIAVHLNTMGADRGWRQYWSPANVGTIIDHPIYGGRYEWRKVTQAAYKTITKDGQYMDAQWSKSDPKSRRKAIPAGERIEADMVREDLRTVDEALIVQARARREREKADWAEQRRRKADRSRSHWLRPFMVCGECGQPMHGQTSRVSRKDRTYQFDYFRCSQHKRTSQLMPTVVCRAIKVRQEVVEAKLAEFMNRYGQQIELDLEQTKPRVASLVLTLGQKGSAIRALREEMTEYVLARLPEDQQELLDAEGGIPLVDAYRHYYDAEVAAREREIEEIETRIADMAIARVGLPKGGVADRTLIESIHELEAQAAHLRDAIVPIDRRIDAIMREYEAIRETMRAVSEHSKSRRLRQATEALRRLIARIEVHGVDAGYGKSASKRKIADRLVFVPVVGEPIEFKLQWPSRFRPETAARARELLDKQEVAGQIDLRAIAKTLQKEGHHCYADRRWSVRDVIRLLAGRISAPPPSARGPRPRTPRRGLAGKDGGG